MKDDIKIALQREAAATPMHPKNVGPVLARGRYLKRRLAIVRIVSSAVLVLGILFASQVALRDTAIPPSTSPSAPVGDHSHPASCPEGWVNHSNPAQKLSVCTPAHWSFESRGPAGLVDPNIDFEVGSWRFRSKGACAPTGALLHVPAHGVFYFGYEYPHGGNKQGFAPRPPHFALGRLSGPFECLGVKTYLILFRQHHRYFQIHVKLGREAGLHVKHLVLRSLDSLQIGE